MRLDAGDPAGTVPLFLGGEDGVANLQLIDLDVSWTIGAQLRARSQQVRGVTD